MMTPKLALCAIPVILLASCGRQAPAPQQQAFQPPQQQASPPPPPETNAESPVAAPSPFGARDVTAPQQAAPPPMEAQAPPPAPDAATPRPPMAQPSVVIPAGTHVRVRLANSIDTRRNAAGDRFTATLDAPIERDGRVLVPKGTPFTGHLTASRPSGRLKGRAVVALALDSFRLEGRTYRVDTTGVSRVSGNHKKRNAGIIGGGSAFGAIVGALAGGGKGALIGAGAGAAAGTAGAAFTGKKNVHLPVETALTFELRDPVRL